MHGRQELEENIRFARTFQPLTEAEQEALLAEGKRLAENWGTPYGPVT